MSEVTEYQQVAAITSMDIDMLALIAKQDRWSAEELRELIIRLKEKKDLLITDAKIRNSRYNATTAVFKVASKK